MTTKELAAQIEGKAREIDVVMRDTKTPLETKSYFMGLFLAELKRICETATI